MRNLHLINPLGYLDFLCLMDNAKFVVTDSGGIQEETSILGIPCITLRNNTERPITAEKGTNVLISTDKRKIMDAVSTVLKSGKKSTPRIPLWDGHSAQRIVSILLKK